MSEQAPEEVTVTEDDGPAVADPDHGLPGDAEPMPEGDAAVDDGAAHEDDEDDEHLDDDGDETIEDGEDDNLIEGDPVEGDGEVLEAAAEGGDAGVTETQEVTTNDVMDVSEVLGE